MNVFYEDDGHFKVAAIFADNVTSLQVEAPHGKRAKIKAQWVLLRFDSALHEFMPLAEEVAADIDVNFLWEASGGDEFGFADLARDYFGAAATAHQQAGLLLRLHASPMHFYKKGRGRYKPAPSEALKAALASVERKRLEAEQQASYIAQLTEFRLPAEFSPHVQHLLYKPDRNGIHNKALEAACAALHLSPARLLEKCGAIPSIHDYHVNRFLFEHFPRGVDFSGETVEAFTAELPLADAEAFSIDDAATTEIDDAFSVTPLAQGGWRVGVHIAAPALGIAPGSLVDGIAQDRLSTVYYPSGKITMLPDSAIAQFTLAEGQTRPVLSLYLTITDDFSVTATESRLERIAIARNLRLDELAEQFTEANIASGEGDYPYRNELDFLWRFAGVLEAGRGKADNGMQNRLDYAFRIDGERIAIEPRRRGSPPDKVVSELMILVNSLWGERLAQHGVAALYRIQQAGKVRLSTHPAPHEGLGVAQYAWASSPIRRYVDLINQRQLVAHLSEQPLPYPKPADLLEIMRSFELAYDAYAEFQRAVERYWCLRYLEQENRRIVTGSLIRDNLVRLDCLPLIVRVNDIPALPPASNVELEIGGIDLLSLEISCRFRPIAALLEKRLAQDS
ncbi:MAG: RNB domain-containing ribonuclease [Burkholderiales bacterium]|nr:RNB domain-containing ribonuclease [Burkholderiales bacterium]